MAEEGRQEEKIDFTSEGQALGYISMVQAGLLATQTARETPGNYGRRFRGVPMAFEVAESGEQEDFYNVTISFRPEGAFTGTPGRERFFIRKDGVVALRQVLNTPRTRDRWPLPMVITGVAVVTGAVAIAVVVLSGGGRENIRVAAPLASSTPVPTPTEFHEDLDSILAYIPPTSTPVPTPGTHRYAVTLRYRHPSAHGSPIAQSNQYPGTNSDPTTNLHPLAHIHAVTYF